MVIQRNNKIRRPEAAAHMTGIGSMHHCYDVPPNPVGFFLEGQVLFFSEHLKLIGFETDHKARTG